MVLLCVVFMCGGSRKGGKVYLPYKHREHFSSLPAASRHQKPLTTKLLPGHMFLQTEIFGLVLVFENLAAVLTVKVFKSSTPTPHDTTKPYGFYMFQNLGSRMLFEALLS